MVSCLSSVCYGLLDTMVLHLLQAVYHMPTQEEEMPSTSIPLALQSTFYKVRCYILCLMLHAVLQIDLQFMGLNCLSGCILTFSTGVAEQKPCNVGFSSA